MRPDKGERVTAGSIAAVPDDGKAILVRLICSVIEIDAKCPEPRLGSGHAEDWIDAFFARDAQAG